MGGWAAGSPMPVSWTTSAGPALGVMVSVAFLTPAVVGLRRTWTVPRASLWTTVPAVQPPPAMGNGLVVGPPSVTDEIVVAVGATLVTLSVDTAPAVPTLACPRFTVFLSATRGPASLPDPRNLS